MHDPQTTIESVTNIGADAIILDLTIVNNSKSNKLYIQHKTPLIGGSYTCYTISEQWLINKMEKNYYLVESFNSHLFPESTKIDSALKGYIFSKKNNKD